MTPLQSKSTPEVAFIKWWFAPLAERCESEREAQQQTVMTTHMQERGQWKNDCREIVHVCG